MSNNINLRIAVATPLVAVALSCADYGPLKTNCISDVECADGLRCAIPENAAAPSERTCVFAVDEVCTEPGARCVAGTTCDSVLVRCAIVSEDGACDVEGASCVDGRVCGRILTTEPLRCVPVPKSGDACSSSVRCSEDETCQTAADGIDRCVVASGLPCDESTECAFGEVCRTTVWTSTSKKTCAAPAANGERCDDAAACELGSGCYYGRCGIDFGSPCATTSECRDDGVCVERTCMEVADEGGACEADPQCLSQGGFDLVCSESTCGVRAGSPAIVSSICESKTVPRPDDSGNVRCLAKGDVGGACLAQRTDSCRGDLECIPSSNAPNAPMGCFVPTGTDCSSAPTGCVPADVCRNDGMGGARCLAPGNPTETCDTSDDCKAGLECHDGSCRLQEGATGCRDGWCAPTDRCTPISGANTSICRRPGPLFASCAEDTHCAVGICDHLAGNGQCRLPAGPATSPGAVCSSSLECQTNALCLFNRCIEVGGPGAVCELNAVRFHDLCASPLRCLSSSTCEVPRPTGTACVEHTDCTSGVCVQAVCS